MHSLVTTALDVGGLITVAVGVAWGLWPVIDGAALIPAGFVVLGASAFAAVRRQRQPDGAS